MRSRCLLFILYSMDNKETLNVLDQPGALILAEKIKQLEGKWPMNISIIDGDAFYEGSDTLPEGFHIPSGYSMVVIKVGMLYVPVVNISISSHTSYFSYYFQDRYYTISINHDNKTYTKSYENLVKVDGSIRNDGQTYGIKNGVLEIIAGVGEDVLTIDSATAMSIAIESYKTGTLQIDSSTPPEIIKEVMELMGDDFNELAALSVSTMELTPKLSPSELLERAKEDYHSRKESVDMAVKDVEHNKLL